MFLTMEFIHLVTDLYFLLFVSTCEVQSVLVCAFINIHGFPYPHGGIACGVAVLLLDGGIRYIVKNSVD
jgi:hypothetical protein